MENFLAELFMFLARIVFSGLKIIVLAWIVLACFLIFVYVFNTIREKWYQKKYNKTEYLRRENNKNKNKNNKETENNEDSNVLDDLDVSDGSDDSDGSDPLNSSDQK